GRRAEMAVEAGRELAGAAAEVDGPAARGRFHQRQQVVERAGPLGAELPVLGGVPGVGRAHPPLLAVQAASVAFEASASPSLPPSLRRRFGGASPAGGAASPAAGGGGSCAAR